MVQSDRSNRIPDRENAWWCARERTLADWMRIGLARCSSGLVLKTDLFDEAAGSHYHADLLGASQRFLGMDIDPNVARRARDRISVGGSQPLIVIADIRALPFENESIQCVISLSTLDHFEQKGDIRSSLAELRRILVTNGTMLATFDNPKNPEVALRAHLPRSVVSRLRSDTFHVGKTLSAQEADSLFDELLLTIEHGTFVVHAPRYVSIRIAGWLAKRQLIWLSRYFEVMIRWFESLEKVPLRSVTGHYTAWRLSKRTAGVLHPDE
jgi:SAM-dependent methyltransferase